MTWSLFPMKSTHLNGFGNFLESEAIPGALPVRNNTPQRAPLGLSLIHI